MQKSPKLAIPAVLVRRPTLVDVDRLKEAKYNPRRIKAPMLRALKESMKEHGFLQPIIVQRSTMEIIGGHQRLRAWKEVHLEAGQPVPKALVVLLDVTDRQAKRLNVSLNKVGGEFDMSKLGALLSDMDEETPLTDDEKLAMGLTDDETARLMRLDDPTLGQDDGGKDFGTSVTASLDFEDIRKRDYVRAVLKERAKLEGKKSGEIVYEMLGGK